MKFSVKQPKKQAVQAIQAQSNSCKNPKCKGKTRHGIGHCPYMKCYNCNTYGHTQGFCPEKQATQAKKAKSKKKKK